MRSLISIDVDLITLQMFFLKLDIISANCGSSSIPTITEEADERLVIDGCSPQCGAAALQKAIQSGSARRDHTAWLRQGRDTSY